MARPSRRWVIRRLRASGLLSVRGIARFARSAMANGSNLASLLDFAARHYRHAPALVVGEEALSFAELASQCDRMAAVLREKHAVGPGDKVGVLGRNGAPLVRAVFAASRVGARVYLLNPDMAPGQLATLISHHELKLVIADEACTKAMDHTGCPVVAADRLLAEAPSARPSLGRVGGGELVVLTGGTTGLPKAAPRRPAPSRFLLLFVHLAAALELDRYPSAFLAVPLSHGYGIAAFLVALTLGRTVHMMPRFDAAAGCGLIEREGIQAMVVVPSMLRRMLGQEGADLSSLRCVVSGGAALAPQLALETRRRLGDVLFNLYGTSEGGVAIFAAPADLAAAPDTIGREIWGVTVTIRGEDDAPRPDGELGRLCVESKAAVASRSWIETGDVGFRDAQGRLFVRGRSDDMIVSGGENVHPWEVESVLETHPDVREAVVVGVPDPDFGQRLVAFVVPAGGCECTAPQLSAWLSERVARYQRPRAIELCAALPLTPVGKVDRKALIGSWSEA